jgi:hypothetical protein
MQFTLPFLKKGQRVRADVVEVIAESLYIVNFQGDLLRIRNSSRRVLKPGDQIYLEVTALKPLGFKIVDPSLRGLDRSV